MSGVLDLNNTPWILPSPHAAPINFKHVFRANNREGHQPTELSILLHSILIVFLDVVWEIVDGYSVVLNVFHDQLLRLSQLGGRQRISLADNWDDVDTGRQALHELDVKFSETVAGRCDEVEERVDTVVAESRVTLDTGFFGENVIVLSLEVANNFTERRLVINLVAKAGGINDGQRNAGAFLVKL